MPGFISEEIEPVFDEAPELEKKTGAPSGFKWKGREYRVTRVVKEWHEYPQGRSGGGWDAGRPPFAQRSTRNRGSWGQGKDFYRVIADDQRMFDIYFDRHPKSGKAKDRKGRWILFREFGEVQA